MNVHPVIDNLWEWARPKPFPSRRSAAFAAPNANGALASQSVSKVYLYRVQLPTGTTVAQLQQVPNALCHPDIRVLGGLLRKQLGDDWFSLELLRKGREALLFCPCLVRDEVENIMSGSTLLKGEQFREQMTFWRDVKVLGPEIDGPSDNGEIFFTVPDKGYRVELVEIVQKD
jgi:hypothetical protein